MAASTTTGGMLPKNIGAFKKCLYRAPHSVDYPLGATLGHDDFLAQCPALESLAPTCACRVHIQGYDTSEHTHTGDPDEHPFIAGDNHARGLRHIRRAGVQGAFSPARTSNRPRILYSSITLYI